MRAAVLVAVALAGATLAVVGLRATGRVRAQTEPRDAPPSEAVARLAARPGTSEPRTEPVDADEVRGVLVASDGTPLDGVRVEKVVPAAYLPGSGAFVQKGMGWTDDHGRFSLRLPDGATWLLAAGDPHWRADPVLVRPGDGAVRIVAGPRDTARVRVLDGEGAPVAGAEVRVDACGGGPYGDPESFAALPPAARVRFATRADNRAFAATTDVAGRAVVPLPDLDGDLRLQVTPAVPDLFGTTILPFRPTEETEVRLEGGATVSGVVVDSHGRPFCDGSVSYEQDGRAPGSVSPDEDGRFRTPLLHPGLVRLAARDRQAPWGRGTPVETTVSPGARDVRLAVDTGEEIAIEMTNPGADRERCACLSLESDTDGRVGPAVFPLNGGRAVLRGLRESESYVLWIPPTADSGSVYLPGLRVRDGPRSLTDTRGVPVDVEVRWRNVVAWPWRLVVAERGVQWEFDVFERGEALEDESGEPTGEYVARLRVPGLPAGSWRFHLTAYDADDREFAVEVAGEASTPVTFDLRTHERASK